MGDLLHVRVAGGRVRSLNDLFNEIQFEATRRQVRELRLDYGHLLKGPPNNPANEHKRHKRLRSLRFAASLLNDDINFKPEGAAKDPSGGKLRHWLRWLTWIERLNPNDATLTENRTVLTGGSKPKPHDLITRTIERAIGDDDAKSITFDWTEQSSMEVNVSWDAGTPRAYRIAVKSKRSSHSDVAAVNPAEEDEFDPQP